MIKYPIEQYIEENRNVRKPEIQRLLDISRATLGRWIKSGKFIKPAMKQNGRSIWLFKDVQQWITEQKVKEQA